MRDADKTPSRCMLEQSQPKRVMKLVSRQLLCLNRTCQNPALASAFENALAPDNRPNVCSTEGMGSCSLKTKQFNSVKFMQTCTLSLFSGTRTIGAHRSVGSWALDVTPRCSMPFSSWCVVSYKGSGTVLCNITAKDVSSSLKQRQ